MSPTPESRSSNMPCNIISNVPMLTRKISTEKTVLRKLEEEISREMERNGIKPKDERLWTRF